jgi:hypothetical protein
MSVFSQASAALAAATAAVNGGVVTYNQSGTVFTLTATFGHSLLEVDDGAGGRIEVVTTDFIVNATDIAPNGVVAIPQEGDQITNPLGAVFELMTPPFRPSDVAGVRIRLHGKQIL